LRVVNIAYTEELKELNQDISQRIGKVEEQITATKYAFDKGTGTVSPMTNPDAVTTITAAEASEQSSSSLQSSVKGLAGKLAKSVQGEKDGAYYSGGFLSFNNLLTTNAALQMVHHKTPFSLEVLQAPDPEDGT
jgi:hypothetical protein